MLFYRLLLSALTPVLITALLVRVLRGQEQLSDFSERLGLWRDVPKGPIFWAHGASNGELSGARPILEGILSQRTDIRLFVTCNSTSAKAMVKAWQHPRVDVRLAPLDLRWLYLRILKTLDVERFILIEADFWPNRLIAAQGTGSALCLIGGRMSQRSGAGWSRFRGLAERVFATFDMISAQDSAAQNRLLELGAHKDAFKATLNLKSLFQGTSTEDVDPNRHNFWLAASTHDTEDDTLLRAHIELRKTLPRIKMILAPRHPKRADDIERLAKNLELNVARRSTGAALSKDCDVYLADTLGEMDKWYRAAAICFVAGSLAPKGGHTPFEPAYYNCAILHGPHLENFQSSYDTLAAEAAAWQCSTPKEIAEAVIALQNNELAVKQCQNAQRALAKASNFDSVLEALLET
ncbi:glycosyltransferase N-terminal domain-containing protein [Planktotalea sp.]|uniref:3-deoxy-D-manno-octulosonic acid transferase n=1 Tax=Planktotalea sp. TaxID=2029877 RepID=UPI0032998524